MTLLPTDWKIKELRSWKLANQELPPNLAAKTKQEIAEILQWGYDLARADTSIIGVDDDHDTPSLVVRSMQGKTYAHIKTGGVYRISGYIWDSGRNRWLVRYVRIWQSMSKKLPEEDGKASPAYCHLPEDFLLEGRFLELKS